MQVQVTFEKVNELHTQHIIAFAPLCPLIHQIMETFVVKGEKGQAQQNEVKEKRRVGECVDTQTHTQ